jgi:hypothetical protein
MAATPFEHADQAGPALRVIVTEHGPDMLSRPRELANLLADLLPDAPKIARLLVTAAQDQVAGELREHTSAGMDVTTASKLVASSFAGATMLAPDACAWVVREFAIAIGLAADPDPVAAGVGQRPAAAPDGVDRSTAPMSTEPAAPDRKLAPRRPAAHAKRAPVTRLDGARAAWTAVISADRGYFEEVIAEGALDEKSITFPGSYPERSVTLSGTEMRIGRRSFSRGLTPEIDLAEPPADPGISHLHAVLIAQQDGTWLLLDQGSSNGTSVNGRQVASGVPVQLRDGDRICLGAWTVLTVRSR